MHTAQCRQEDGGGALFLVGVGGDGNQAGEFAAGDVGGQVDHCALSLLVSLHPVHATAARGKPGFAAGSALFERSRDF